jgi:hypothetical protein
METHGFGKDNEMLGAIDGNISYGPHASDSSSQRIRWKRECINSI